MTMDNTLSLLGLSKKAGLLEIGEESVNKACRYGRACLVMTAEDTSDRQKERTKFSAEMGGAVYIDLPYSKFDLGTLLGRGSPGIVAMTDIGMAVSFVKKLSDGNNKYENELNELSTQLAESKKARSRSAKSGAGKRRTKI